MKHDIAEFQSNLTDYQNRKRAKLTPCFLHASNKYATSQMPFLAINTSRNGTLRYKEEIASGKAYEGRKDLGEYR